MTAVPVNIDTSKAHFPESYEAAKKALAKCESMDECMQWGDKARALASYAKQAEDNTLHAHAKRIRARAIRRAGELLKQIDRPEQGGRPPKNGGGGHPVSRTQAATEAGMSEQQRKDALRVASVPADDFERQVESDDPPTTSRLAEQGKRYREQPPKQQFEAATYAVAALRSFVHETRRYDPERVASGLMKNEVQQAKALVSEADSWLDRFVVNIGGNKNEK